MKKLPKFLEKYFWDVDFQKIDFKNRRAYVLKRILEHGDPMAVKWMNATFDESEIKSALINFRGYSRKSANFWAVVLDIPKETILCLMKRSSGAQKTIWQY